MHSLSSDLVKRLNECQHPVFVTNKYSGAQIKVDCGVCDYCIHKRAQRASIRVKTAGSAFKYCYFVTLTYDNANIPLYHVKLLKHDSDFVLNEDGSKKFSYETNELQSFNDFIPDKDPNKLYHVFFEQVQGTVPFDREIKQYVPCTANWFLTYDAISSFINKTKNDSPWAASKEYGEALIPFINYVDVQNYIKRIRKHLSKFTDEKISFYAVSEYGPVHFRPHFHLLLFFNSQDVEKVLRLCHNKSWQLGRSDIQRSTGGSASYVASYVNSLCSAPLLYRSCSGFKPRSRASLGFFEKGTPSVEDEDEYARIERKLDSVINGTKYNFNGIVVNSTPPISYIRTLLPRFTSTIKSDYVATARIIDAVATAPVRMCRQGIIGYDPDSILSIVRAYCRYLLLFGKGDWQLADEDKIIMDTCRLHGFHSLADVTPVTMKIYRLFLLVSKFLRNWNFPAIGESLSLYKKRILYILRRGFEIESAKEYLSLVEDYKLLENHPEIGHSALFLYEFGDDSFQKRLVDFSDVYNFLNKYSHSLVTRAVKHKHLNDANEVLNNKN